MPPIRFGFKGVDYIESFEEEFAQDSIHEHVGTNFNLTNIG